MKLQQKRSFMRALSLLLSLLCLLPLSLPVIAEDNPFRGEAALYYDGLCERGFPADYAKELTELHLLHPTWCFEPLLITEEESTYTWDHVILRENVLDNAGTDRESANNTISKSDTYKAYRHPTNTKLYDSGKYQVSDQTLAYFMDPRNFLNETDIFQFLDLSVSDGISREAVDAVLAGTFMEESVLENGKSFSEYFIEVGAELGINPVFLAVKARQEQGVNGTSPIISGLCGTELKKRLETDPSLGNDYTEEELLALDGYYNLFNVGANGNGVFSIYYNAMSYAKNTGSASMTDVWGSPSWDTLWKSLYGGAAFIKKNYVSDYVTTIYLQKFNVDSRAFGNFWKQYMQNVTGAFSEGRSFYSAFASTGTLDSQCTFLIPVYGAMPPSPSPDPANGTCPTLMPASERYTSTMHLTLPTEADTEQSVLYTSMTVNRGEEIAFSGEITHSYGVDRIEYAWDGGDFTPLCEGGVLNNVRIPVNHSEASSHILSLRGIADYDPDNSTKKTSYAFLCAVIYVEVEAPEHLTVTLETSDTSWERIVPFGETLTLPDCKDAGFVGWLSSENDFLPAGAVITPVKDLSFLAVTIEMRQLTGAALVFDNGHAHLRFSAAVSSDALESLSAISAIELYATCASSEGTVMTTPIKKGSVTAHGEEWQLMYVDSKEITPQSSKISYTVRFSAALLYSNGTRTTISVAPSNPQDLTRSGLEVALAAIADIDAQYDEALLSRLLALTDGHSS